jgi:hypothetical protein
MRTNTVLVFALLTAENNLLEGCIFTGDKLFSG